MASAVHPLRRLLSRREADELLRSFAPLIRNEPAALFDSDGHLFAGAWPMQSVAIPPLPAGLASQSDQDGLHQADRSSGRTEPSMRMEPSMRTEPSIRMDGIVSYPLRAGTLALGFIAARQPLPALEFLQKTLNLMLADRIEKRDLRRETLDRYREVNLLYRIAEEFGGSLDPDEILDIVLAEARRVIQAISGAVVSWTLPDREVERMASFGSQPESQALMQWLRGTAIEDRSFDKPDSFSLPSNSGSPIAAIVYAPLTAGGKGLGLVCLARQQGQADFTAGDTKLLQALASLGAIALEKAWLYRQELKRQHIEQELEIGRRIQHSLLPKTLPDVPGWEFAASYQAASQVGGDFYDLFQLNGGPEKQPGLRLGLAMADVTGKGIPAALMMAFSQSILRVSAAAQPAPGQVLQALNEEILKNSRSGLLLTVFYAVLDPSSGGLRYSNGGHDAPFWYRPREGKCVLLDGTRGVLVGAYPDLKYPEGEIVLAAGEMLVLFTDGFPEARNSEGEFFGEERLEQAIARCGECSGAAVIKAVLECVREFTGGAPQSDDLTLLVIKRQ